MFNRLFLAHPRAVGESYAEHATVALWFSGWLFVAALASLIHAIVPGVLQRTASGIIARLYARMTSGRRAAPVHVELDYAI